MNDKISGLHHVTAIAGDTQENLDFYTEVLGLRLVKKTVNFDDKFTYHLYYGDKLGHPGTILTFFPFRNARWGRVGRGQTAATSFVVPADSLEYWGERLESRGVDVEAPQQRFDGTVVAFEDHEGQPLELVTAESDVTPFEEGPVPQKHAIRGFYGVTLDSLDAEGTTGVLELMGFEKVAEERGRTRFRGAEKRAATVDVLDHPDAMVGQQGAGTVHHIAFRTPDNDTQARWRERIIEAGLHVTPRKDRQYFQSIYFREPGGVLFEIATEEPGFTVDEPVDKLGAELKLPPWLEEDRDLIEEHLPPMHTPTIE